MAPPARQTPSNLSMSRSSNSSPTWNSGPRDVAEHRNDAPLPAPRGHQRPLSREHRDQRPSEWPVWSRALWDIRQALGPLRADTLILEAQFSFAPDTSMPAAATATVAAAQSLYGNAAANAVRAAFVARGIL